MGDKRAERKVHSKMWSSDFMKKSLHSSSTVFPALDATFNVANGVSLSSYLHSASFG